MATATVKSTYSLDLETHDAIAALAKRLRTSKSDVIRKAVKVLRESEPVDPEVAKRLEAARRLRRGLGEQKVDVAAWLKTVRNSRR
jgi:Arc/MetJ-type ribon-helix-helix transcriptional regulator